MKMQISVCMLLLCSCFQAVAGEAEKFLGPPVGMILFLESIDGFSMSVETTHQEDNGVLTVRQCFNLEKMNLPKVAPKSWSRDVQMIAEGQKVKLIGSEYDQILLDLDRETWQAIFQLGDSGVVDQGQEYVTGGLDKRLSGHCWKSDRYRRQFLGKERTFIEVSCKPGNRTKDEPKAQVHRITLISGIGPIQLDFYDVIRLEKAR